MSVILRCKCDLHIKNFAVRMLLKSNLVLKQILNPKIHHSY